MSLAPFALRSHNPDVLTCIANLSNDEVFTPPEMASAMLDLLAKTWADSNNGADIWTNPNVTFLDPFTKSGVFLREIVRRLTDGLATTIPDLEKRVDHILTRQVYAIAITRLTGLLARRSVYCSKYANGPHSRAESFTTEDGNIWFERTEHTWAGGTREFRFDPLTGDEVTIYTHRHCIYCGASEDDYERSSEWLGRRPVPGLGAASRRVLHQLMAEPRPTSVSRIAAHAITRAFELGSPIGTFRRAFPKHSSTTIDHEARSTYGAT
ncbi:hypothetical protein [Nocardiopsis sp. CNR-923]|uniref:hypothetical protein n=1 Tax=Nocardiopsis sp. CNR-923 TaxID=1904965 RepID=UPI000AAA2440|nr:hypothetical protein [Nocardiopsis sp. CNR-923]